MTLSSSLVTERVADTGSLAGVTPGGTPDGTKFLRDDLSWAAPGVAPGSRTITGVKTANYTAAAGEIVRTDTSGGAFTLTLPATPADGSQVDWWDSASGGSWPGHALAVARGAASIDGVAANLSVARGQWYAAIYRTSTTNWQVAEVPVPSDYLRTANNLSEVTPATAFGNIAPTTTKGDLVVRGASANVRLAVGTNTQVLTADSAQTSGVKWATTATFDGLAPTTTKGDLVAFSTVNARVAVGTNGQVLTADSTQATGVKWGAVPAVPRASAAKSANFTLAAADNDAQDEATGSWTLAIPAAGTLGDNFLYTLTNVGAGTVTLDGPGATNGSLTASQVVTVYTSNAHVYCVLGAAITLS